MPRYRFALFVAAIAALAVVLAVCIAGKGGRKGRGHGQDGRDLATSGDSDGAAAAPDRHFGPFGGVEPDRKLVAQFDADGNGWLGTDERRAARAFLAEENAGRTHRRGPGGFGPPGGQRPEAVPGPRVSPDDVKRYPDEPLYAADVLRTLFLEFEDADWEAELEDFKGTDVRVPAKLIVDGKTYADVGVHFHGQSSYMSVPAGYKRSLVLGLDFVHREQRLQGFHKLMLLNSHEDPSFLRSVLSLHIARAYMPAPQANFVRVVINGESWGVYVNQQHFDKDFLEQRFGTRKGARWKVPGSPNGHGGLKYLGEDLAPYRRIYELKSKEKEESWTHLVRLCKLLTETPASELEKKLAPVLDVDEALRFLAWDNVLVNGDGYWTRASDYNLYEDPNGRFRIIPYDANETFSSGHGPPPPHPPGGGPPGGGPPGRGPPGFGPPGFGPPGFGPPGFGPPGRGGPGHGGVTLDPLVGVSDTEKPLLSKLLAAPALRARYLGYVRDIAEHWLDWERLGPVARRYQAVIAAEVEADTRKLDSNQAFASSLTGDSASAKAESTGFGPGPAVSIKEFADKRRRYLLDLPAVAAANPN